MMKGGTKGHPTIVVITITGASDLNLLPLDNKKGRLDRTLEMAEAKEIRETLIEGRGQE